MKKKLTTKQKAFVEFLKRIGMAKQGETLDLVPNNEFEMFMEKEFNMKPNDDGTYDLKSSPAFKNATLKNLDE